MKEKKWDVFISHASEDKTTVAKPLANALKRAGVRVWLDEHELRIGDSLSEKIDEGLSESRFGIVILSPAFLEKHWPKKELAGLRAREEEGQKVILPVWHNVDKPMIAQFSPILADALAASTNGETSESRIYRVAQAILDVVFAPTSDSPSAKNPSVARRFIEILESAPQKPALLDFLNFNLRSRTSDLGWFGVFKVKKYRIYEVEFDACVAETAHGCYVTLISFTEAWSDPFERTGMINGTPKICSEVEHTISSIRKLQERFKDDAEAQERLRHDVNCSYSVMAKLSFFIFAGRRSRIDSSKATHDVWSKLLQENSDIAIKSYDFLVDAFLKYDRDNS